MGDDVITIGTIVHYVSFGTPGGEYRSVCRAAMVTEVDPPSLDDAVSVIVFNPTGLFFNDVERDETTKRPGTWHLPEIV